MRTVYLLGVSFLLLTSCTRNVQVVTLRGNNVKPTDTGLILDNDTLTLRYTFTSERGRIHFSITNKLNQPLYVDWKRSSLIVGQDKVDYWRDVSGIELTSYNSRYGRYSIGRAVGTVSKDEQVTFIPPKTKIDKQQFVVLPTGNLHLSGTPEVIQEKPKWNPERKKPVNIHTFMYGDEKSPLSFRNYITLSTDKDFKTEFHIDTQFWASDVKVMPYNQLISGPVQLSDGSYSRSIVFDKPDAFYVPLPTQQ
ncbi:hypothetical protein WBJ53_28630 [Spirosoma sp. SC4-14]|uniref:hypothetical protein n=1 Tax=Spirosoma sp. SC4-14 TaxID=3128900 RepID=UPI0030CD649C